jgi:hypothetical protein
MDPFGLPRARERLRLRERPRARDSPRIGQNLQVGRIGRAQRIDRGEPHSGRSQVCVRPWLGAGGQPEQRVTGGDERMRPVPAGTRRDRPGGQGQRGLDQAGDAGRRPAVPDASRDGAQRRDGPAALPEPRQRGQLG